MKDSFISSSQLPDLTVWPVSKPRVFLFQPEFLLPGVAEFLVDVPTFLQLQLQPRLHHLYPLLHLTANNPFQLGLWGQTSSVGKSNCKSFSDFPAGRTGDIFDHDNVTGKHQAGPERMPACQSVCRRSSMFTSTIWNINLLNSTVSLEFKGHFGVCEELFPLSFSFWER